VNVGWHANNPIPKKATTAQRIAWHTEHQEYCRCRPIPAKLQLLMTRRASAATPKARLGAIRSLLTGGDRRSIADSNRARVLVERNPALVRELAALAADEEWLIAQRAVDLLEKLAHEHPEWIEPYKRVFIGPLADSDKWEIRLQIVRALPLFRWTGAQAKRAEAILLENVSFPQTFVRAWALDSLATLGERNATLMPIVMRSLREFDQSTSKALQARARKIRERLVPAAVPPRRARRGAG
jgi:hypothetical protein